VIRVTVTSDVEHVTIAEHAGNVAVILPAASTRADSWRAICRLRPHLDAGIDAMLVAILLGWRNARDTA
jgi:hypothetical protein